MKRDPLSNEPFDSAGISTSSSSASTFSGPDRKKATRRNSDTAWNWVLFLALVASVYYFWIFPIQSPRKPLKVIFENGAQTSEGRQTGSVQGRNPGANASETEIAPEAAPADKSANEPATDLERAR